MKLYGYEKRRGTSVEDESEAGPLLLREATISATPGELRKLALFFELCAAEMERDGSAFEHEHLADHLPGFTRSPQLVVFRPT